MFINNKYQTIYHDLVESRKRLQRQKTSNDGLQVHHIIPRSLGGDNSQTNLVPLTLREHRIAHKLLTKFTTGNAYWKMLHAYSFFDTTTNLTSSPLIGWTTESHAKGVTTRKRQGSYKRGKDNVFSTEHIKQLSRTRMKENNPMKNPEIVAKYKKARPHSTHVRTPQGYFYSLRAAAKFYNTTPHLLRKEAEANPTLFQLLSPQMRQ